MSRPQRRRVQTKNLKIREVWMVMYQKGEVSVPCPPETSEGNSIINELRRLNKKQAKAPNWPDSNQGLQAVRDFVDPLLTLSRALKPKR